MNVLVKLLRGLIGPTVLVYLVMGIGIGSAATEGLPPGGWGVGPWVLAPIFGWVLLPAAVYQVADAHQKRQLIIVMLAPLVAFALGALFGTAPYFWAKALAPLRRH